MAVFSSGHPPGTSPVRRSRKVPHDLLQAVNRIRDLLCSFDSRIHGDFPTVVESISSKLLLALKVSVDSALFEPCRSHQIGEGGAVTPFLIEDRSRLTNDVL